MLTSILLVAFLSASFYVNDGAELENPTDSIAKMSFLKTLLSRPGLHGKQEHRVTKRNIGITTALRNLTILSWQPWNLCDVTNCNQTGFQSRRRSCVADGIASEDELFCGTALFEQRPCRSECLDGSPPRSWSEWTVWSSCSVTCGYGNQIKYRVCEASSFCSGYATETKQCNANYTCPQLTPWLEWSPCSATCGTEGTRTREKHCVQNKIPASNVTDSTSIKSRLTSRNRNHTKVVDIDLCDRSESSFDFEACEDLPICNNLSWSNWEEWSDCTVSCGHGFQTRIRYCSAGPGNCSGRSILWRPCFNLACWTQWVEHSSCSKSCGTSRGFRTRYRYCDGGFPGTAGCEGNDTERIACETIICPLWSQWSQYGSCSKTCDQGERIRTRQCLNGVCRGPNSEAVTCYEQTCPHWSDWSPYTCCSETCGNNGVKQRTRVCRFSYGLNGCAGNSTEEVACPGLSCNVTVPSVFDTFQCGRRSPRNAPQFRILGGEDARITDWPWQASFQHRQCTSSRCGRWTSTCGATLVAAQWLVTAAHCVTLNIEEINFDDPGNNWSVLLGTHNLDQGGERSFFQKIIVHPDFVFDYIPYVDLALLKLREPLTLSPSINPICLSQVSRPVPDEMCTITGWGYTGTPSIDESEPSSILQEAEVPILSFESCTNLGRIYQFFLNETQHFCSGNPNTTTTDSCEGDSGSSLVCRRDDNQYYFTGVTSFGFWECGTLGQSGIYVPIHPYEEWIRTTIETDSRTVC